jgi:aminoglycoside phosphotransferase (APT) family kinase protein/8-oxo-dGTP pyrophosphatase MutT (NUDIX family)
MCIPGLPSVELVQLYDAAGEPAGVTDRHRMRTENLTHAATAVVVRDPWGRVYVHRRTDTKDVYPGRFDFAAGGVVGAGEDPRHGAVRELAEELGVHGVTLEPIRVARYTDDHTDYWGHCFTTTYDGPITWQPEEVAEGGWWTLDRLVAALDTPPGDGQHRFMPDTVALLGDWLRERLADRVPVAVQGWDSHAEVVEGTWLDRTARRPEVARWLATETRLMPRLADRLPLTVPVPTLLDTDPPRARHRLVPGAPIEPPRLTADDGARVGGFLRALHDTPPDVWAGIDVPRDAERLPAMAEMTAMVLPRLPADLRPTAEALAGRCREATHRTVLRHGDLGPEHLLVTGGRVTGVIDWTDVALGDHALDLAWLVHRTPAPFARSLVSTYGATDGELARGRDWNTLGPWWEVHHGLTGGGEQLVASGLEGAVERLRATVDR